MRPERPLRPRGPRSGGQHHEYQHDRHRPAAASAQARFTVRRHRVLLLDLSVTGNDRAHGSLTPAGVTERQAFTAAWNCGELTPVKAKLSPPLTTVGSGKDGTPWVRRHCASVTPSAS